MSALPSCPYDIHGICYGHTYGTVRDTMDVIRTGRNGRHFNTLEKYHIYRINSNNLHMNDTNPYFRPYRNFTRDSSTDPQKRYVSGNSHTERLYKRLTPD
jgi:hypothetical protein